MKQKADIGIIGLGVMGSNLARNMASHGFRVAVYNRTASVTDTFVQNFGSEHFIPAKDLKRFVASLEKPRKVMIMVKAGGPVDVVIEQLLKHLGKGDIIIDGGNSFYKDTARRSEFLGTKGIHFVGCGVSGGEEGALNGPSLMPGCSAAAWRSIKKMFESIAAKDFAGKPCVTRVGPGAAGHYVKMVHNGIEYAIMQLMAESYALYRNAYKLSASGISEIFKTYNSGKLQSFLFEIAVPVLAREDEKNGECCLIYKILDTAGSKGTGKWTVVDALDRGVAVPSIAQAVFARSISGQKGERVKLHKIYKHTHPKLSIPLTDFKGLLRDALHAGVLSIFAQGFNLILEASKEEKWQVDPAEVARIWQGGCIIRTKLLAIICEAYKQGSREHLFEYSEIAKLLKKNVPALRNMVSRATATGIALPGFSSSLFYFESMIEERLPANFTQGLRDYFGAHTYERIDMKGTFHTDWD